MFKYKIPTKFFGGGEETLPENVTISSNSFAKIGKKNICDV